MDAKKFMDSCDTLIPHDGIRFDFPLLLKMWNYTYHGKVIDTRRLSQLIYPNLRAPKGCSNMKAPHSVEAWGIRLGRWKPDHTEWDKFSEAMLHRCVEDCFIQLGIYRALMNKTENYGDWSQAIPMTMRLFQIVQEQVEYGWKIDVQHFERCIRLLDKWVTRIDKVVTPRLPHIRIIEEKLDKKTNTYSYVKKPYNQNGSMNYHISNWCFNNGVDPREIRGQFSRVSFRRILPNKREEMIKFLLDQGWEPQEWNTNKITKERTSPKLSYKDSFFGVGTKVGQLVAKRIQCLHRKSTIEGWLEKVRPDGRLPNVITGLAATGRAKHSVIVNIPNSEAFFGKYMRKGFICDDDKVIVGTDSAGCQNRMLAARVNDAFFTKTLLEGKKSDQTSIHFVNKKAIEEHLGFEITYGNAKNLNYAFMFGASDKKLGSILHRDAATGAIVRKALLSVAAGFEKLMENLTAEWKSNAKRRLNKWKRLEYYNGWITGLDGRAIFIESEHTILVYMLQSDEAIMMSMAYCKLYQTAQQNGLVYGDDWGYLAWIHDEFQCEVKKKYADRFAKWAEDAIVWAGEKLKIACPHEGESDIGKTWAETH